MAYYATYMPNELGELQKVVINAGVGFVLPYYGETAPPGTLACDGSEISRAAYGELFQVLGTKAGAGDGSTTFNLPDFRNRWIVGAGDYAAMTDIEEGIPNLTGMIQARPFTNTPAPAANNLIDTYGTTKRLFSTSYNAGDVWDDYVASGGANTSQNGATVVTFNAQGYNAIYGASAHVTPASVALLWCIIYE